MRAGFGSSTITPPLGTRMFGWGSRDDERGCEGVHDDLFARALWLTDGGEDVLVMGFDLLFFSRDVADRLRGAVGRRFGLAPRQILLNTSHTHNGPTTGTWWTALFAETDRMYLDRLERAVLTAAEEARHARREVSLWSGVTRTAVAVSRRKIDADGRAVWEANKENTIYDSVPVCLFRGTDDRPVCLLFSVSCHPSTVPGHAVSADYPGVAMAQLDAALGADCSLFLQGVGGDTKVRSYASEPAFGTTWNDMTAAGNEVAEAILAAVDAGLQRTPLDLHAHEVEINLPMLPHLRREECAAIRDDPDAPSMKRMWAGRMAERLDRGEALPTSVSITMHGIQIGRGLRIIGIEGEVVADHGALVESFFGGGVTFPLGYCDGCQLYLPSDRMLPQGGYEVVSYYEYHFPAQLAPGIDRGLTHGMRQLRDAGIG